MHEPPAETAIALPPPSAHEPRAGDVVDGRYLVLGELGRGSLGVVLEAEALSSGKRVAIKWLSAVRVGDQSHERFARFQREGRALAQVWHPNVVDVHDLAERDGTPFVVTERLYGETLRARLARGPLSWDEARRVVSALLDGLGAAHRAGITHRELKPENIFLCLAERHLPPTPKLLDFGMACWRPAPDGALAQVAAGLPPATPAYLAPEQLTGGPVDARTDLYALGVIWYEALTGQLPFEARGAAGRAVLQATAQPRRPSSHQPALRGRRERVVLRALGRTPHTRYPDATAFAAALDLRLGWRRPALAKGLAAAAVVGAAAYSVYAGHGVEWSKSARASSVPAQADEVVHVVEAPVPTPEAAPASTVEPPPTRTRPAPPKPSKRWLAYRLAVERGAEATRALQAALAGQGSTPAAVPEATHAAPRPASEPNAHALPVPKHKSGLLGTRVPELPAED
jgi:serine/threonine protein kinase